MGLSFPALQRAVQDDPATLRAQGGPPAGGQHRRLRRGQPRGGPRSASLARHEWLAARRRARRAWASRSSGLRVYGRRSPFSPLAVLLLAGGGGRARRPTGSGCAARRRRRAALVGRGRDERERDPAVRRRLARDRQRQAPQPAPLRWDPHAARARAGDRAPASAGRRDHRPRVGRHGLGGRLPQRRRGALTVFEIAGPAARRCSTRVAARDGVSELRGLLARPAPHGALADGRHALARGERATT